MIKLVNLVGGELTANQVIPLQVKFNTNDKISFDSETNLISINKSGYYMINANITFTGATEGIYALELNANGVPIPDAECSVSITANGIATLIINDIEKVLPYFGNDKVKLSLSINKAVTILSANVSIFEIR